MTRYLGGLITKDESLVLPSNNYEDTSAPGVWTLEEAQALNKQGLWPTAGVVNPVKFIENIFSVDTYIGNSGTQTITTGIDTSGEGGLVWVKSRSDANHSQLYDTIRGSGKPLYSSLNNSEGTNDNFASFTSSGFTLGYTSANGGVNGNSSDTYVAWTFRKAPKFFDVISWTGDNVDGRTISHNLGATPGFIMVKLYAGEGTEDWICYHRSLTSNRTLYLNTSAVESNTGFITNVTSTGFDVDNTVGVNATGRSYIAYIFGHDTSSDGMIQCGEFTTDSNGDYDGLDDLGFEPQWIMIKGYEHSGLTTSWVISDHLRGLNTGGNDQGLLADQSGAEFSQEMFDIGSQGFKVHNFPNSSASGKFIYIAIRRGPMATPTTRASVFAIDTKGSSGDGKAPAFRLGNIVDMQINRKHATGTDEPNNFDLSSRLLGTKYLVTNSTANQSNNSDLDWAYNNGVDSRTSSDSTDYSWLWRRAPKYFDIVAYTGNGSNGRTINHNLGVVPDMIWFKIRDNANSAVAYERGWVVTSLHLPNATATNDTTLYLDTNAAEVDETLMNDTAPTSTVFSLGTDPHVNYLNVDYVAYLFATLAGISKIGTFSHTNGSSTDVDCGFSSGSMLVIVKRTDSTSDWYVWDSSRGIVSGNDPYLALNSTDNPVTNTDYIDTLNSGFQMSSSFITGSYFFYAIAA